MFSIQSILSIALVVASSASGLIIPRHRAVNLPVRAVATQPATYAAGYLEPYETYHLRYLAIGCNHKHNTTFFDTCCHPLLATENLKTARPAECSPTPAELSSASAAMPTSTVQPDLSLADPCDESSSPVATPTPSVKANSPAKNVAPSPPKTTPTTTPKANPKASPKPSESSSKTHSSSVSKPSTSSSSGLSGTPITGGVATFFTQNGNAGACGTVHKDSDFICAIDQARYGNSGAQSSLCGKQIKIVNTTNGKSVTVTVADDCPTCKNANSIDLSVAAFTQIATEAEGEVEISWQFV